MLRLPFLIIFSILSFTFATYGQRCGGGTYWLNFVQKEPIKFELYSVTPKGMSWYSDKAKDWVVKNLSFFHEQRLSLERSVLLDKNKYKKAEDFLKEYKTEDFNPIAASRPQFVKAEGNTINGVIMFNTSETLAEPAILKLISKSYGEFYLYGYFFGGCGRTEIIDLSKNTIISR